MKCARGGTERKEGSIDQAPDMMRLSYDRTPLYIRGTAVPKADR